MYMWASQGAVAGLAVSVTGPTLGLLKAGT